MAVIYPRSGSIADELFRLSEAEMRARFGEPTALPAWPIPKDATLLPVNALVGVASAWWLPDYQVSVFPHFPPFSATPDRLFFAYLVPLGQSVLDPAAAIGLPQPDMDPATVVGKAQDPGGRIVQYLPGPPDLAALEFRVRASGSKVTAAIMADKPPHPQRYAALVTEWRQRIDWAGEGTMYFRDQAAVHSRQGTLYPPGAAAMRALV